MRGDDDRADFAAKQRVWAEEMGRETALHAMANALVEAADHSSYSYVWRWLGVPIIQMPSDIVVLQEVIWDTRPDLIIETGVARGGSVILSASILELLGGDGIVIGVDIDVRPHNRETIESHPLARRIRLVEGSSVAPEVVAEITNAATECNAVMVILDSNHSHEHVAAELAAYASLVSPGQFLVVADTVVEQLPTQAHRPRPWGPGDNPATALAAFLASDPRFERDAAINGKLLMSSSPGGFVRRLH